MAVQDLSDAESTEWRQKQHKVNFKSAMETVTRWKVMGADSESDDDKAGSYNDEGAGRLNDLVSEASYNYQNHHACDKSPVYIVMWLGIPRKKTPKSWDLLDTRLPQMGSSPMLQSWHLVAQKWYWVPSLPTAVLLLDGIIPTLIQKSLCFAPWVLFISLLHFVLSFKVHISSINPALMLPLMAIRYPPPRHEQVTELMCMAVYLPVVPPFCQLMYKWQSQCK
ncbi:hypothetical protein EDD17DRAFT_1510834 [Pisolithus thermaeus]|nr:hypothetical protein EDD17DRAFT_1510834 [Pisolithus thermaeus]